MVIAAIFLAITIAITNTIRAGTQERFCEKFQKRTLGMINDTFMQYEKKTVKQIKSIRKAVNSYAFSFIFELPLLMLYLFVLHRIHPMFTLNIIITVAPSMLFLRCYSAYSDRKTEVQERGDKILSEAEFETLDEIARRDLLCGDSPPWLDEMISLRASTPWFSYYGKHLSKAFIQIQAFTALAFGAYLCVTRGMDISNLVIATLISKRITTCIDTLSTNYEVIITGLRAYVSVQKAFILNDRQSKLRFGRLVVNLGRSKAKMLGKLSVTTFACFVVIRLAGPKIPKMKEAYPLPVTVESYVERIPTLSSLASSAPVLVANVRCSNGNLVGCENSAFPNQVRDNSIAHMS